MKCHECIRDISRGDMPKRAEFRRQPDKSIKVFGINMPDGPLEKARGPLVKVLHSKCYWVVTKRVRRHGDAVTGTHPGLVDAYDEDDDQPARIRKARESDAGYQERPESDWRPQTIGEV